MSQRTFLPDGHEYVTAAQIHERWPDVSAHRLRVWLSRGLLDVARDPDGNPVRIAEPGRRGPPANVYRWADVVAAERQVRLGRNGP